MSLGSLRENPECVFYLRGSRLSSAPRRAVDRRPGSSGPDPHASRVARSPLVGGSRSHRAPAPPASLSRALRARIRRGTSARGRARGVSLHSHFSLPATPLFSLDARAVNKRHAPNTPSAAESAARTCVLHVSEHVRYGCDGLDTQITRYVFPASVYDQSRVSTQTSPLGASAITPKMQGSRLPALTAGCWPAWHRGNAQT